MCTRHFAVIVAFRLYILDSRCKKSSKRDLVSNTFLFTPFNIPFTYKILFKRCNFQLGVWIELNNVLNPFCTPTIGNLWSEALSRWTSLITNKLGAIFCLLPWLIKSLQIKAFRAGEVSSNTWRQAAVPRSNSFMFAARPQLANRQPFFHFPPRLAKGRVRFFRNIAHVLKISSPPDKIGRSLPGRCIMAFPSPTFSFRKSLIFAPFCR